MTKLPVVKPKKLLAALLRYGFYIHHQKGSHVQLRHKIKKHLRVTVPSHASFDLPIGVTLSILAQAEMTKEELFKAL